MSAGFPIKEFRIASLPADNQIESQQPDWADIDGLILNFDKNDSGSFLVTLDINCALIPTSSEEEVSFRVVLRTGPDQNQPLGQGSYIHFETTMTSSFSLVCKADISPTPNEEGSSIVAQWQVAAGNASLKGGTSSLSAIGSLAPTKAKVAFNDTNHWENPDLFSRALRLSNFSETLFLSGYGPTLPGVKPGQQPDKVAHPGDPVGQMQWIVDHLDAFFRTIPYADGTGNYSKYDVVYFDLVVDSSVLDNQQQEVLEILMEWLGPVGDKISVYPKPSTGILKKVAGLATSGIMVEMELILAH